MKLVAFQKIEERANRKDTIGTLDIPDMHNAYSHIPLVI